MIRRAACLAILLASSACATLPTPIGTEAVGPGYAAGGGQWDDGATVIFLTRAFEHEGQVAFCGIRTAHSTTTRTLRYEDFVPRAAKLLLAGDTIANGLRMLPEARYRDDMTGATARCLVTDRPWRAAHAGATPEIRIPRLQFNEGNGFGFGGGKTVFRGAPVHRPLP